MHPSEKVYAKFLKANKIKYVYVGKTGIFKLEGTTYRPDFYLSDFDTYVEVVSQDACYRENKHKYDMFKKIYKDKKLKFAKPDGSVYIPKEDREDKKGFHYKVPIQIFINKDLKRQFRVTCVERGLKPQNVLNKLVVDFCRTNETKPLR